MEDTQHNLMIQAINQSINQSINRSINQWKTHSITSWSKQSINQSIFIDLELEPWDFIVRFTLTWIDFLLGAGEQRIIPLVDIRVQIGQIKRPQISKPRRQIPATLRIIRPASSHEHNFPDPIPHIPTLVKGIVEVRIGIRLHLTERHEGDLLDQFGVLIEDGRDQFRLENVIRISVAGHGDELAGGVVEKLRQSAAFLLVDMGDDVFPREVRVNELDDVRRGTLTGDQSIVMVVVECHVAPSKGVPHTDHLSSGI